MATDDERREVARRLREKKAECEERGYPWMCDDLILALGYDHDYEAGDEIFDRLADLIEPTPNRSEDTPKCDREALLALADKMSRYASLRKSHGMDVDTMAVMAWVHRIREACGEVVE